MSMNYMLVNTEEMIAKEWEKYIGYTVRPLASTIQYYSQWIQFYSRQHHFLLYGGTPEIRNIFQQFKLNVTIIDQSEKMVRAMGRLTEQGLPISKNESFKQLNWLSLSKINQSFDLLIGDDAINMMDVIDYDAYLNAAHQILKKDGIFICHLLVKPKDAYIHNSFLDVVRAYKKGEISSVYDLASRLNFICFDKKNQKMGWQQTIKQLGSLRLNYFLPHFDFKAIFGNCNSQFSCLSQSIFESLVKKYFYIKEIFYPHEHDYCLYEPVYILSK